jgi:hypothetical protein
MTAADHNTEFEELMAWLDGELTGSDENRVRAHVDGCIECQQMEQQMRSVSGRLATWIVPTAPATFSPARHRWSAGLFLRWLPAAAALVLTTAVGATMLLRERSLERPEPANAREIALSDSPPLAYEQRLRSQGGAAGTVALERYTVAAPAPPAVAAGQVPSALEVRQNAEAQRGPLLVRTAHLTLVPTEFDTARAQMERIVISAGGYTGRIVVGTPGGEARSLTATLRIPTARLDETLAALRKLGKVTSEGQDGEDVTQQSTDLDARLANSRAAEVRLKDIMAHRTGRLSDVLQVEQEIARVRGEIEQMEAQRKALDRRITLAAVTIQIAEERKAAVDLGPLPIAAQFSNAVIDGYSAAVNSALEVVLAIARVAPVAILWALVLAFPAWIMRRRLRQTFAARQP